ncbi:hypothetical protein PFISCL1PPCAC_16154, partial [Pristionchus fissidentatus]
WTSSGRRSMFPFLAPLSYDLKSYRIVGSSRHVELQHWISFPVAEDLRSSSSNSLKNSQSITPSPPPSRASCSTPRSRPDSRRSTPLPVPDVPISKRNRGFETSSAMKELFGGGPDYAAWERKQKEQQDQKAEVTTGSRNFGRKNLFEKERIQTFSDLPINQSDSIFSNIPDHDRIYEKCHKKVRKQTSPQGDEGCQPGPENFDGEEDTVDSSDREVIVVEEEVKHKLSLDRKTSSEKSGEEDTTALHQPGPEIDEENEERGESADGESETADETANAEEDGGASASGSGDEEQMSVLIKGAQVVNDDSIFVADVLVQGGVITAVAPSVECPPGVRVVDGEGKILMPAGIDVHTHFTAPNSADDLGRGTRAAVAGGTATVVETAWPRDGESLLDAIKRVKKGVVDGTDAVCNVALSGVVQKWDGGTKSQMERAVKEEGVNSFIVDVDEDDQLYQVLSTARSLGVHVRVLPERKCIVRLLEARMLELGITGPEGFLQSRPEELEGEKVASLAVLSKLTNCPVSVLQLSSAEASRALQEGRSSSSLVHAEVATAALATDGTHYFNKCAAHAAAHLTEAPLRPEAASAGALMHVLANCPLSVVASGHRAIPATQRTKQKDFTKMPRGVAAAEERMAVLWEKAVRGGRIDAMRFVALTSSNAAKIFNLYPKKGRIAVGADGDLVLWDVNGPKRALGVKGAQSAADSSPFEGMNVHSRVAATVVGGRVAWQEGAVQPIQQGGKDAATVRARLLVETRSHSPYLYGVVQQREKIPLEKVDREAPSSSSQPQQNGSSSNSSGVTRSAVKNKNLQSNISFGGGDTNSPRSSIGQKNPPGGRPSGFW